MRRSVRFGLLLVLFGFTAFATADELSIDFKSYKHGDPDLRVLNNASKNLCTVDEKGLVIAIPKDRKEPTIAGVTSNFALQGDFEITLRYDGLTAELPPARYGTGVSMWLTLDSKPVVGATVGRTQRPDGTFFVANRVTTDEKGKEKYEPVSVAAPPESNAGRLRLVRAGKMIRHLVSVGVSDEFKEIRSWEIGDDEVGVIRFQGSPNGLEHGVKVRLIDLSVKADKILRAAGASSRRTSSVPPTPAGESATVPEEKSKSKLWLWVAIVAGVLIAAAVALTLRKRRTSA